MKWNDLFSWSQSKTVEVCAIEGYINEIFYCQWYKSQDMNYLIKSRIENGCLHCVRKIRLSNIILFQDKNGVPTHCVTD